MIIAERRSPRGSPRLSVCVPHYNRMLHLIELLRSLDAQSYRDFEVIVSDDNSTDERVDRVLAFLDASSLAYTYWRNASNGRYDVNLRNAIDRSSGDYILLMGNDDRLAGANVVADIAALLDRFPEAGAIITNYFELGSGRAYLRARTTGSVGAGPEAAARNFRNYSFVSGVVLHGDASRAATSPIVDGSEMYQMYLGTKIVAEGRDLVEFDAICIEKDIAIQQEEVDSYRARDVHDLTRARRLPMRDLVRVAWAALKGALSPSDGRRLCYSVATQLYSYTYPFWGFEYRRTKSWWYASNVIFGLRPSVVSSGTPLGPLQRGRLWLRYLALCGGSLLIPVWAFDALRPALYRLAKRRG
ncbi:MAG: glycosyltransferase family 2 protein [Bauldia sp.]